MTRIEATMRNQAAACGRNGERGAALIMATLIAVILSMLGISYLMMSQTETTIAENERNAMVALYVAEAGTRLAVSWFNDPTPTGYLVPTAADVDRSLRLIDHDFDPSTARVQASSGNASQPIYKDSAFTASGILDRPYRGGTGLSGILSETFFGIETGTDPDPLKAALGPDLVVSGSFLTTLNNTLLPTFPSENLRARVSRIEIYGPPVLDIGGVETRMGIATVKVTSGVFLYPGTADERQIATRIVKAVINEIPVPGPVGPLQSCAALEYDGAFSIHWGSGSSVAGAELPTAINTHANSSVPYNVNDPFTYISTPITLADWATARNGQSLEDPWFKFIAGGDITGPAQDSPGSVQPWPYDAADPIDQDHTNLFQNTVINCPAFDYNLWKSIAQSGMKGNYYYKYDSGANFRLDGTGPSLSFQNATSGKTGVLFFDTTDSLHPNGLPYTDAGSNLTPAISVASSSGWQGMQGFVYLNTKMFETTGAGSVGSDRTIFPPGEPGNSSTDFVNLNYPGDFDDDYQIRHGIVNFETFQDPVTGDWYCTDASTCTSSTRLAAASPVRDVIGLPFQETVVLDGVMFISGVFNAQGNAQYFGSVVTLQGVIQNAAGSPDFYFDESLVRGQWPRKGMNMPRVIVSVWETDL